MKHNIFLFFGFNRYSIILYLINFLRRSERIFVAIFSGAFLGLLAFGTYEITNFVILKDWKIELVIIDTLWGIVITGSMSYVGYKVYNFFS